MASKAVIDAVAARLAAEWSGTVFELNYQNETPSDESNFLEVQYPVANGQQITIGNPGANVFRETGVIRFVLNVQRGKGLAEGSALADQLAALFRAKQFGGVTTWAPSTDALGDASDNGNYFQFAVAVPYFIDLIA